MVIFLITILTILFVLTGLVLLTPLITYCDTDEKQFYLQLKGITTVRFQGFGESPHLMIETAGFAKKMELISLRNKKKSSKTNKKVKSSSGNRKSLRSIILFVKEAVRTFSIKKFILDIDSDDYVLNAQLYPLFYWMSSGRINLSINYQDRNYLQLMIENRLIHLVPPLWRLILAK